LSPQRFAERNDAMKSVMKRIGVAGCAVLLAGCISPQNTRFPTLGWNPNSQAERQSYTYHNPLPDPNLAKEIERPRGFENQRAEPQLSKERRAITDDIVGGGASSNPSASRYPASISP
jgi:hypothetical protein